MMVNLRMSIFEVVGILQPGESENSSYRGKMRKYKEKVRLLR